MAAVQNSNSTNSRPAVQTATTATTTSANTTSSKPTYEELEKRNQALDARLKIAEAANAEIQNVNDSLAKRMDAMELEKRTEKVASIVQGAYDENIDEKITAFIKSGLSVEDISKIVAPLKASRVKTKQASTSGPEYNYSSTVAIQNESLPAENGKKEIPAWASNYLHVTNGGST